VKNSVLPRRVGSGWLVLASLALVLAVTGLAGAQTFEGPVNVSGTGSGNSRQPHIVIDAGGVVHVAWADDINGSSVYEIRYKRSFDGGRTFTGATTLSTGIGAALRPRMATGPGNRLYVVWMQDPDEAQESDQKEIMFVRSVDGGESFSAPVNLSGTPGHSQEGRVAVDPAGGVHVVWDEGSASGGAGGRHLAYKRSLDGGSSFEEKSLANVVMTPCAPGSAPAACTIYPGIAIDANNGRIYVTWHDRVGSQPQVRFTRSFDGGNSFAAPVEITHAVIHAHCAAITVGPTGRVLVAYEEVKQLNPHTHNSMYIQSVDAGASFSAPINFSNTQFWAMSDYPWPVEAPNGTIVVGWEDNGAGGALDALLAVSNDGGASFGPPNDLSNNPEGVSTEVITAFGSDGTLYVVWEEHFAGDESAPGEVLLRRAPGFGSGPGPGPAGNLSVVLRGTDNGIYQNRLTGSGWLGWTAIPGATPLPPAMVKNGEVLELVVQGTDSNLYHNRFDGTNWVGWTALPGVSIDTPALAMNNGMLELVVRGLDNGIFHNRFDGTSWAGWTTIPGQAASAPALAGGGFLELVVHGTDNGIYHNRFDGTSWLGWTKLPGATNDAPAVAENGPVLDLVVRGTNNGIYHNRFDGASWLGWTGLPGATGDAPSLVAHDGILELAIRGTDNGIYTNRLDGSWQGWLNLPGKTTDTPTLAVDGSTVHLLVRGTDGQTYHSRSTGGGWLPFMSLGGGAPSRPAAAAP
jgi:hypothetical protein